MLVTLLAAVLCSPLQEATAIEGDWAGSYQKAGGSVALLVSFVREDGTLAATIGLPEEGFRIPAEVALTGSDLVVTVREADGSVSSRLRGELDGATIRGRLEGSGLPAPAPCELLRVVALDDAARTRFAGRYLVDEETELSIERVRRKLDEVLVARFPAEGWTRTLFAISSTEFVAGPQAASPLPIEARFTFELDERGEVVSLELRRGSESLRATPQRKLAPDGVAARPLPKVAPDLEGERRDIRIPAGDVTLAATLYFPPGAARPCPAVVQLHGSGATSRFDQWHYYTSIGLRSGLAVLAYDKRGCGESTGTFPSFSVEGSGALFDALARDAAYAHAWLRGQEGIDPKRVGLVGGSQAGWIMPLVAERTEGVRFIVSGCGPSVSAGEEQYHERLLEDGTPLARADLLLESYTGPRGYDPREVIARSKTPTLWLFGARDDVIPTNACISELERIIKEGNTSHVLHVFAEADHNYRTPRGDGVLLEPVIRAFLTGRGILP